MTVTTSPASGLTALTAGTSVTETLTVPAGVHGYVGLPLQFSESGNTAYNVSGMATLPSSATIGSSGSAAITFMPDPVFSPPAPATTDYNTGSETVATAASAFGTFTIAGVAFKVTTASTASVLSIAIGAATTTIDEHGALAAIAGSTITVSSTDSYGNVAPVATSTSVSLTTVNLIGSGAGFGATSGYTAVYPYTPTGGVTQSTSVTIAAAGSSTTASTVDFYYGVDYGDTSYIVASANGLSSVTSVHIVTYTISTTAGTTSLPSAVTPVGTCVAAACVKAGATQSIEVTLPSAQAGVPVYFTITNTNFGATAADIAQYGGSFSNSGISIEATSTVAAGVATASVPLTVDTTATDYAQVTPFVTYWTGTALGNYTGTQSGQIETIASTPTKLDMLVSYASDFSNSVTTTGAAVNGTKIFLDVYISDAYGNLATNPGPGQLQIQLTASGGAQISNPTPIIPAGCTDTAAHLAACTSFGAIYVILPTTIGTTVTITASAAGLTSTKSSLVTVSATPAFTVTSPTTVSGVIYSNSLASVFSGYANVSAGFPSTGTGAVSMATLGYKVGSGAWNTVTLTGPNPAWSFAATMSVGTNTLAVNVTDGNGDVSAVQTFTVLVDTAAPDVNFVTANNANITSPATVSASIVDASGDLNASSVTAVATNIDTSATKTLTATVTGTNNPGHSVTYAVSISGLTTGNWSVALTANDLAGNTNSSTLTVHVTVPFAQSFVVSGTPQSATLGSFSGINASYTNLNPTSQNVVVFAVFKNSAGQTVGIGTGSLTAGAGATQSVFIADPVGLASGTYSVNIFVFTTNNLPVSAQTTISVTV